MKKNDRIEKENIKKQWRFNAILYNELEVQLIAMFA